MGAKQAKFDEEKMKEMLVGNQCGFVRIIYDVIYLICT